MYPDLSGRVAIVTGGGKGIGSSIAGHLADCGADVVICSRSMQKEWKDYSHIPHRKGRIFSIFADATVATDAQNVVMNTVRHLGHLDILINNVGGVREFGGFLELEADQWRETFELNVMTMIHFIRQSYPYLKQSRSPRIITISSLTGLQPGAYNPHYSIAKAATANLSKHLANIFAKDNILVNVVCPGPVHSDSWDKNISHLADVRSISIAEAKRQVEAEESGKVPLKRIGEGSDIAGLVSYLASEQASWITGSCFVIDGGKHCSMF